MKIKHGMILAAGLGKRMQPLTLKTPKPLLEINNYTLLKNLRVLTEITENILVGISRKSMIGSLLNKSVNDRLEGSLAATVLSIINCAKIIRTHDVRETKIAALIAQEFIGINK